jgi:hypothetical protein
MLNHLLEKKCRARVKINFNPDRMCSFDETGVLHSTRRRKRSEWKGRDSGYLTSAERRCLVTVVTWWMQQVTMCHIWLCFCEITCKLNLWWDVSQVCLCLSYISRWVETDVFTQRSRHFTSVTKPTIDEPASLILGGHYFRTKNFDVILFGRENKISLLCLPPHR